MDYNGKLILAPMVRVGTHPMRLLAAGYGADIVYTEELVDKRVIASVRRVNEALGTVDFLDKGGEQGGRVMFRTSPAERPRLVFQLGTADGAGALAASSCVAGDVGALDVNMGCPKQFSLQGGMGAALLRKPEVAEDILKTLRRNLALPVSCKIRVLDDPRATVELARRLAACGICALAVHGRTPQQRPRDPADWGLIRLVVDALAPGGVPVIANGDVMSYDDAQRVRQETGCAAAMVARAAMWNASVFRGQGFLPLESVQREYVRLATRWDNALQNTKYCLKEMADAPVSFTGRSGAGRGALFGHEGNTAITRARDGRQLCALVGVSDEPPYQDLTPTALSDAAPSSSLHGGGKGKRVAAAKAKLPRGGGGGGAAASGARKRARADEGVPASPREPHPAPSDGNGTAAPPPPPPPPQQQQQPAGGPQHPGSEAVAAERSEEAAAGGQQQQQQQQSGAGPGLRGAHSDGGAVTDTGAARGDGDGGHDDGGGGAPTGSGGCGAGVAEAGGAAGVVVAAGVESGAVVKRLRQQGKGGAGGGGRRAPGGAAGGS